MSFMTSVSRIARPHSLTMSHANRADEKDKGIHDLFCRMGSQTVRDGSRPLIGSDGVLSNSKGIIDRSIRKGNRLRHGSTLLLFPFCTKGHPIGTNLHETTRERRHRTCWGRVVPSTLFVRTPSRRGNRFVQIEDSNFEGDDSSSSLHARLLPLDVHGIHTCFTYAIRNAFGIDVGSRRSWSAHPTNQSSNGRRRIGIGSNIPGRKLLEERSGHIDRRVQRYGRERGSKVRTAADKLRLDEQRRRSHSV